MTLNDVLITGLIIFIIIAAFFAFSGSKYEENNDKTNSCNIELERQKYMKEAIEYCKNNSAINNTNGFYIYFGYVCSDLVKASCSKMVDSNNGTYTVNLQQIESIPRKNCDREVAIEMHLSDSLLYCKYNPNGIYYADACGVPWKLVC